MFFTYLSKLGLPNMLAKFVEVVIVLALIGLSYLGTYQYGKTVEGAVYKSEIAAYDAKVKALQDGAKADLQALATQQSIVLQDLNARLAASEKRKQAVQVVIKEVPTYVTQKADSQCVITAGFEWLYNRPIVAEHAGISAGAPENVDAPTQFKLSDVAATAAKNNVECAERGEIISDWQIWYQDTKKSWDFVKAQMPKPPSLLH